MRTKKSTLELTPLLDVVLIILFVFMMLLASKVNESAETKKEAEETIAEAEENLENALANITELEEEIEKLNEENTALRQSNELTAQQLDKQREISDEQQETAENLAKAVAEFIKADETQVKKLLDENDLSSSQMLKSITSTEDIAEELLKFEAISRQFYFIDLELKTSNNRLYINDESTSIGISSDEVKN